MHGEPPAVNSDRDPVSAAAGQPEQGLQLRAPVLQLRDCASASDRACARHMPPWQPGVHGRPAGPALHARGRKGTRSVFSPPRKEPGGDAFDQNGPGQEWKYALRGSPVCPAPYLGPVLEYRTVTGAEVQSGTIRP